MHVTQDTGRPSPGRALVEEVLDEMHASMEETAQALTKAVHSTVTALDDELYRATLESVHANVQQITAMLAQGLEPSASSPPDAALAYARAYVHEGLSLECLSQVYRQAQQAYLKLWLQHMQARTGDVNELADATVYFSDWLFAWVESIQGPLESVYMDEHERQVRGGAAMRTEEVRAILVGNYVDVSASSARLNYRLEDHHVGFVVWSDSAEAPSQSSGGHALYGDMDRLSSEVIEVLGASASLSVPLGRVYAGWVSANALPDPEALPRGRSGLRVAVGRPGRGLEGFTRSHREAMLARRVAMLGRRQGTSCVLYSSVALDVVLTSDMEEARRFVEHELGPLLDDSDATRRIAATVEVFLQESSSYARAARRLGVHEKTVTYRVRRAEQLLERKVSERGLELQSALRLARLTRSDVLTT